MNVNAQLIGAQTLDRKLRRLAHEYPRETVKALNRTAQRSMTRTRRELAKEIGLPQRELRNRIKYFRASVRQKPHPVASTWIGTKTAIALGKVQGARMTLGGELRAGRIRIQTFRATMPNGYQGSFVRKSNSTHRKRDDGQWTELPIAEPSIPLDVPGKPILHAVTGKEFRTFFPKELRRLIQLTNQRMAARR